VACRYFVSPDRQAAAWFANRQAALWRGVRLAVEAYNRRDLDVVVIGYQADLE